MYELRRAQIFTGTKKNPKTAVILQQLVPCASEDGPMGEWVNIPLIWASPADQRKYEEALEYDKKNCQLATG